MSRLVTRHVVYVWGRASNLRFAPLAPFYDLANGLTEGCNAWVLNLLMVPAAANSSAAPAVGVHLDDTVETVAIF